MISNENVQGEGEAHVLSLESKSRTTMNLFNAGLGGNKWWAIDIRKGDELDEIALKALLREAVGYKTKHSVQESKGSRVV